MRIDLYEAHVAKLASENSSERVSNTGPAHAAVILSKIFENADSHIQLYSGEFKETFFSQPSVKQAMENFLAKPSSKLDLVVQIETALNSELLQDLKSRYTNKINAYSEASIGATATAGLHFCVADKRAYRIETNDEQVTAVASFNEPAMAIQLSQAFDNKISKLMSPSAQ